MITASPRGARATAVLLSINVEGINQSEVTAWLSEHTSFAAPLSFQLITGGHSNLTYLVQDAAGKKWVLRRPPLNSVLATAHDMGREFAVVSALKDSDVPVPPLVGLCTDESVNGPAFYVMDFVEGTVTRDASVAEKLPMDIRKKAGVDLVEVMVRLHALDPDAVGLGDLGKKSDYVARQLRRWMRQVDGLSKRDLPLLREVHSQLEASIPEQSSTGIVHGDYRLDNCIVDDEGQIAAVLDWELCTLGDTRADLGTLIVYWAEPEDDFFPLTTPPTIVDGFARRRDLVEIYTKAAGEEVEGLEYFVAFSYWRLACILEGVYARYSAAAMGKAVPKNLESFTRGVDRLTQRAADILGGAPPFAA